jgi:hypothetical protein
MTMIERYKAINGIIKYLVKNKTRITGIDCYPPTYKITEICSDGSCIQVPISEETITIVLTSKRAKRAKGDK